MVVGTTMVHVSLHVGVWVATSVYMLFLAHQPVWFCFFFLSNIFLCLSSLILTIILSHSSIVYLSNTLFRSLLHVWHWHSSISMVLFMALILSFNNNLSVFLIMLIALGVLVLLLSLKLTGMMLISRHLRVNLLWFLKSTIFLSLLSHFCQCFTLSQLYSSHI